MYFAVILRVLVRSIAAAAVPLARSGFRVLIDVSIPPAYGDTARKILKEVPFDFVLLRPSLQVCLKRASSREKGAITEYARLEDLYSFFEDRNLDPICDDHADPASLAQRIAEGLNQGRFQVVRESRLTSKRQSPDTAGSALAGRH